MSRRRSNRRDDIPGLTTALTTPFVIVEVAAIDVWLVLQGILAPLVAVIVGIVVVSALIVGLRSFYANLLDGPISRPGCLAGLIMYGVGVVLSLLLLWRMWPNWSDAALIVLVLVPLLSFAVAFVQSQREMTRRRRHR